MTASNISSVISEATWPSFHFTICASRRMPALLTRTSTRPQRATISATAPSTSAG